MLDEGRRRRAREEDVVVAAMQPDAGDDVAQLLAHLESIPLRLRTESRKFS